MEWQWGWRPICLFECRLEYEYLYLDKEITIDKVMAKSKRKKVAKYEVERMEILAPIKSWHMDGFKNRTVKTVDYSSGVENQPDLRYVMYYEGNLKVILEPSMEMVKAIKKYCAPKGIYGLTLRCKFDKLFQTYIFFTI